MLLFQDDVSVISLTPKEQLESRTVRIYSPAKNAMQSGTFGTHKWQIQFDTRDRWENPLMGWTATYVYQSFMCYECHYLRRRRRLCFWCGLFVCLSVGLLANLWTDFDEIFCRGRAWLKDQVIQFWWRSGSRFGSRSPKSEIRILRITH